MSLFDFQESSKAAAEYPFFALIMAAMRNADSHNSALLRDTFPELWAEISARYNAPGGILPDDETNMNFTIAPTAHITPDDEILPNTWMDEFRYCAKCDEFGNCEVMYSVKPSGGWRELEINWLCHDAD